MNDPCRRRAGYLRVSNAARFTLIHKHADYQQADAGNCGKKYLPRIAVQKAGKSKTNSVESFYECKLPLFGTVL
jgi:hypothetical protein